MLMTRNISQFAFILLVMLHLYIPSLHSDTKLTRSEIQLEETTVLEVYILYQDPHLIMINVSSSPPLEIHDGTRGISLSRSPYYPFYHTHLERFVMEPRATGRYIIRIDLYSDEKLVDANQFRLVVKPPQDKTEEVVRFQPISITGISISIISVSVIAITLFVIIRMKK